MFCEEINAVYCKTRMAFINMLCGQNLSMLMAQVAICSQINTKHVSTVWAERTVVEC